VAVTHIEHSADVRIGSGRFARRLLVQHAVFVREVVFLQFFEIFLEVPQMPRLDSDIDVTVFEVALDAVLLDTLPNYLVAPPAHVPRHCARTHPSRLC